MSEEGFRLIDEDAGHLVGSFKNVFVTVWWAPATVEQVQRLPAQQEPLGRGYPRGYAALAILDAGAGRVSAEVRAIAEKRLRQQPPNLVAVAQVIEGTGFGAAAVRSVASALTLLSRSGVHTRTFDALDPAAYWLMGKLNTAVYAPDLVKAVRGARRTGPDGGRPQTPGR
jgi:hypothetical protein